MSKKIMVLWGNSLSNLTEGHIVGTMKAGYDYLKNLRKTHKNAYRLVTIYTDGDFDPSKEIIHAESESEHRLEKRLLDRGFKPK